MTCTRALRKRCLPEKWCRGLAIAGALALCLAWRATAVAQEKPAAEAEKPAAAAEEKPATPPAEPAAEKPADAPAAEAPAAEAAPAAAPAPPNVPKWFSGTDEAGKPVADPINAQDRCHGHAGGRRLGGCPREVDDPGRL